MYTRARPGFASHLQLQRTTAMNHNGGNKYMFANEALQHSASLNGNGGPHLDRTAQGRKASYADRVRCRHTAEAGRY